MKVGLRFKILAIVLLSLLVVGIVTIIICDKKITDVMNQEMIRQLKTTAYSGREFYETINEDSFTKDENGVVKKGDFIITGNFSFVDTIYNSGDINATFFYKEERVVTNILDDKGQRMIGTKASDAIIQSVLKNGEEYFSKNVMIGEEQYYGYYVPVRQSNTNEIIGMFFTGDKVSKIRQAVSKVSNAITYVLIIIIAVSIFITFIIVMGMTNALKRTVDSLEKLSDGVLKVNINTKDLKRKDEISEIVYATKKLKDTLIILIGNINQTSSLLLTASKNMEQIIGKTTQSTEQINTFIDELSNVAIQQTVSVSGVSDQITNMGTSVQDTITSVGHLSSNTEVIKTSSQLTVTVLNQLNTENKNVIKSIDLIYDQTYSTHEYVKKIEAVMEMIREVAAETKMLSLNASIEAARAGEAGRGFAIVAEQVKKLADESNKSTIEIEKIVKQLNMNSTAAVNTVDQVRQVIESQSEQIEGTLNTFEEVNINIGKTSKEVIQVSNVTNDIDSARTIVIDLVFALSALAEENAKSTKTTSSAADDLSLAMNKIKEEMKLLHDMAENLMKDVNLFQI